MICDIPITDPATISLPLCLVVVVRSKRGSVTFQFIRHSQLLGAIIFVTSVVDSGISPGSKLSKSSSILKSDG